MNSHVIADNLLKLRLSNNWTQDDLSEKLNISRQAISKWETGLSTPNLETLLELSKLYKITINEILEPPSYNNITCFEEINKIDMTKLKTILSKISSTEIIKASMGVSPEINSLLRILFKDIDFDKGRVKVGSIRIQEIENIHNKIVDMLNYEFSIKK